jgi:acylpyruvate hydrolase
MRKELEFTNGKKLEIGTIYCLGSNYSKHIKEMGNIVSADPVIFLKPGNAYIKDGESIIPPRFSENVHHEVELVVVIGKDCRKVEEKDALDYVAGYAVGIDATLRDIQNKAKNNGQPWAVAKGFYTSAPISKVIEIEKFGTENVFFDLELKVNGEIKQSSNTKEMERNVAQIISYLSKVFYLEPGDCIFTGTPEGVGRIVPGDSLYASLGGLVELKVIVE